LIKKEKNGIFGNPIIIITYCSSYMCSKRAKMNAQDPCKEYQYIYVHNKLSVCAPIHNMYT